MWKRIRSAWWAVVALALTAGVGYGQQVVNGNTTAPLFLKVGGVSMTDTTGRIWRFTDSGYPYVSDVNYGAWGLFPNIIANQLGASGAAMVDSSQAQATYPYKRLGLYLTPQFDSLSTVVRVAIQVRAHYTTATDSASTFPWYRWPVRSTTAGVQVDSLSQDLTGTYALAQATTANTSAGGVLWPGEFLVKFNVVQIDSTATGNGKYGAYPKTMYVPLVDQFGNAFTAPYTSVRVRVINGVRSRFRLRVDMTGQQ